jgi:uracil-DNA glycosylase family 4
LSDLIESSLAPFQHTSGPYDARVVVVGEAWGESEERYGVPFAGQSGRELFRMLGEAWGSQPAIEAANTREDGVWLAMRNAWLDEHSVLLTNVFALRPAGNNLATLCAPRAEMPSDYTLPRIRTENPQFLRQEYISEIDRLKLELLHAKPNLIILLGATACWALLGSAAIGSLRGAVASGASMPDLKCLATYHPAAVLRQWSWRPVVLADLLKCRREREYAHIARPKRTVIAEPTLAEVEAWTSETLGGRYALLSPDIETMNGQIRCIGFARSASESLVVPFIRDLSGASYWPTLEDELRAWYAVRALLESPIPKLGQNFLFDMQYLARMGLRVNNVLHDTMLLHHTLYPELNKGLGFLASVYCNEFAYKLLRKHGEELKRDE